MCGTYKSLPVHIVAFYAHVQRSMDGYCGLFCFSIERYVYIYVKYMLCKNRGLLTVINHYYPLREYVMRRVAGAASKLVLSWHFILCNGTCFKILYNLDDSQHYCLH